MMEKKAMDILIVEDDPVSCTLIKTILSPYGQITTCADGLEAVAVFENALDNNKPYSLACLDIMLPGIDGQDVLKRLRNAENQRGISGLDGVRIIMVTALGDNKSIMRAFNAQCEGYIVKPIRKDKVLFQLQALGLIPEEV